MTGCCDWPGPLSLDHCKPISKASSDLWDSDDMETPQDKQCQFDQPHLMLDGVLVPCYMVAKAEDTQVNPKRKNLNMAKYLN